MSCCDKKKVCCKDGKDGRDGRDGFPGPVGPIGSTGPTGPSGPTGAAGPSAMTCAANATAQTEQLVQPGSNVIFSNLGPLAGDITVTLGSGEFEVADAGLYQFDFLVRPETTEVPVDATFALTVNGTPLRAWSVLTPGTVYGHGAILLAAGDIVAIENVGESAIGLGMAVNAELTLTCVTVPSP